MKCTKRWILPAAAMTAACGGAWAQDCGVGVWRLVSASSMGERHSFQMVYDEARGRALLYGGAIGVFPNYIELEDTRVLIGDEWVLLDVSSPAPKRWEHALSYDPARGVVVLNGGASFVGVPGNPNNHHIGGTYEFDGTNWALKTFGGPAARHGQGMAYHAADGRTLLFGGKHDVLGTWEWNGTQWVNANPTGTAPPPRGFAGIAYDESRAVTVVFGGGDNTFARMGDTWEWDGAAWTQKQVAGPTPRMGQGMAYDAFRRRVVLFAGSANPGGRQNDVWEWNGTTWTQRVVPGTRPAPRYIFGFAYDRHRNRFLAAGGQQLNGQFADTWELQGDPYVARPPADLTVEPGQTATLTVGVVGSGDVELRWRVDGSSLENGGRISGANTQELVITDARVSDSGRYDVLVTTPCGSFHTFHATLRVCCPADFNEDGGVDGADVEAFYETWENGLPAADFNQDGGIDGADVDAFFQRWGNGC